MRNSMGLGSKSSAPALSMMCGFALHDHSPATQGYLAPYIVLCPRRIPHQSLHALQPEASGDRNMPPLTLKCNSPTHQHLQALQSWTKHMPVAGDRRRPMQTPSDYTAPKATDYRAWPLGPHSFNSAPTLTPTSPSAAPNPGDPEALKP